MRITKTDIPDVRVVEPARHRDERGFLSEVYRRRTLVEAGIADDFVQDNHSGSTAAGTVRGLHYQRGPFVQAKLVRVVRGAIFDVALDLRRGSPSFGRHVGVHLDADRGTALYVPRGFAHGFCTLEPDTEVLYRMSAYYAPEHERGVRWNDPVLAIPWPVAPADALLSDKDRALPCFADLVPDDLFDAAAPTANGATR